jgi:hypothetical protein
LLSKFATLDSVKGEAAHHKEVLRDIKEELTECKKESRQLKRKNSLLVKNNSKWKRKAEKLKNNKPTMRKSRTAKAEVFVRAWLDGDKSMTFREIAEECFLSVETIKNISYKIRHKLCN